MLERIAPHLAMIGIHKNGTWAAQKIIECALSPEEVSLIGQYLRPYVPPLLLDQFGNYVVQSVIPFSPGVFISDGLIDAAFVLELPRTNSCSTLWWIDCGRSLKVASALAVCGLA
jgi:protein JSN1